MTEALQSVQADMNVYATFNLDQHTFIVNYYDDDKITLIKSYDIKKGEATTHYIQSKTDEIYYYGFLNWVDENEQIVDDFSNIQQNHNFYAMYEKVQINVVITGVHYEYSGVYYRVEYFDNLSTAVEIVDKIGDKLVTVINEWAFRNCNKLETITIPNTIEDVRGWAFGGCAIKEVNFLGTIDEWATIDFLTTTSNPLWYNASLKINGAVVKDVRIMQCEEIMQYAFYGCGSLESVIIGKDVEFVNKFAFAECSNLVSVYLQKGSKCYYMQSAFKNCVSLKEVILYKGYTASYRAFEGCLKLSRVYFMGTQLDFYRIKDYLPADCELRRVNVYYTEPPSQGYSYWIYKEDGITPEID